MVAPRTVTLEQIQAQPFIVWNEYVSILAMSDFEELTETQRIAHLAVWYDSDVQNGGHLQYFENQGDKRVSVVIDSLKSLGGAAQADVLAKAVVQYRWRPRLPIASVEEFVDLALENEFGRLDSDYYACSPTVTDLLERFLETRRDKFVRIAE